MPDYKEKARELTRDLAHYIGAVDSSGVPKAIESALREAHEAGRREGGADTLRLDFLDDLNRRLNAHYGTTYRWEMVINHNVNRLMLNFPQGVDINDSKAHGFNSCRDVIDRHMLTHSARRAAAILSEQGDV